MLKSRLLFKKNASFATKELNSSANYEDCKIFSVMFDMNTSKKNIFKFPLVYF